MSSSGWTEQIIGFNGTDFDFDQFLDSLVQVETPHGSATENSAALDACLLHHRFCVACVVFELLSTPYGAQLHNDELFDRTWASQARATLRVRATSHVWGRQWTCIVLKAAPPARKRLLFAVNAKPGMAEYAPPFRFFN
ncbi:hypothetical protein G6K96_07200 [Agrobacterium vitis]|uniref:hypothetical protein n=1 Tax=Agrobacterium vitis TaxID=373 RepID=UPI001572DCE4|nr:hypothetical protein [Agrobacterium vitis]NTA31501.1 hypothetical protein [Agrobacterium vitis]